MRELQEGDADLTLKAATGQCLIVIAIATFGSEHAAVKLLNECIESMTLTIALSIGYFFYPIYQYLFPHEFDPTSPRSILR